MDQKRSGNRVRLTIAAIVIAALVLLGFLLTTDKTKTPAVIAAGVLGSLIASLIVLWLTYYVVEDPILKIEGSATQIDGSAKRIEGSAKRVDTSVAGLEGRLPVLSQALRHGIRELKPKGEYTAEEWLALLKNASERLVLVGHALDKWCEEDFLPEFEAAIIRLTMDGKPVDLLTLPENGTNTHLLSHQRGDNYGRRVRACQQRVAAAYRALDPTARQHLNVRTLQGNVAMPYMLVGNQDVVITCAYPTTSPGSAAMLTVKVDAAGDYGRALRTDVRKLMDNFSDLVDLTML